MNLSNLFEGAVDELEKRRIEDLESKMDDLAHRAKESKDPKVIAALRHEFAKCKAERDSYHYVQEWEDTALGHDRNQTELTPVEEDFTSDTNYTYTVFIDGTKEGTYGSKEEAKAVVRRKKEQAPGRDYRIAPKSRTSARSIKKHFSNRNIDEAGSPAQQAAIAINMKKHQQTPKTDEAEERLRVSPHDAGMHAAVKGKSYDSNPHPAGSKEHLEWSRGHNAMRARKADLNEVDRDVENIIRKVFSQLHVDGGGGNLSYTLTQQAPTFDGLRDRYHDDVEALLTQTSPKELAQAAHELKAMYGELNEHGGGGAGPREWHNYVKAHRTDEANNNVDPILLKALKRMPDGLATHGQVLNAAYDAYAIEKGYLAMRGDHGVTDVYIPKLMGLYKDKHGLTFNEGFQDFNKVEPYAVCLAGKPVKKFDYYEEARRFHDNWKQKLYREGNKEKADKITLMPIMDEGSMSSAAHHPTGPEFTGYWKGTDSATPGNKMVGGAAESKEFKVPATRNFVAKNMKSAGSGQHKDAKRAMKQGDVKHKARAIPVDMEEGAKVDRMQQHIAKSEKELGHSKKDAEAIGWATLNKRGYLDNANKKKHNESVNFMEWAVSQGSRFPNFANNPEVYAQAKEAYLAEGFGDTVKKAVKYAFGPQRVAAAMMRHDRAGEFNKGSRIDKKFHPSEYNESEEVDEGFGTALANVSSKISGHPRKIKSAQQIRNKAMKFKPQPIAETDVEEDYVNEIKKGQKDSNGNTSCWDGYHAAGTKQGKNGPVRNCVPNESLEEFNDEYDGEASMAQGNLYTIAKAAEGLLDTIGPRDNLPEWAQEKIAKVEGMLVTVWNYLQSQKAQGIDPQVTEDWQKANKKDKTDGMSQKAVNAYKREHPGSKLKTAVTTKPSKLKKGSKASKRRKSYCARSAGQKKMHNIDCSKTPDKAICKARKRWNCEGVENLDAMLAEAIKKGGDLQPGQNYLWTVFFDDGSKKRIKVTKDNFDPKAYYAKQNKVVINTEYDWTVHNG